MADALTKDAPLKEEKKQASEAEVFLPEFKFDVNKKYMFELAAKNVEREIPVYLVEGRTQRPLPHKEHKPFHNIVLTSQIVWNGQRRNLRYYDGCTSLFADEQPKDKEMIDQLIRQTKKRNFTDGKFGVYGDERMLLIYLMICSWNANSKYRTRTADAVFVPKDENLVADLETERLDLQEEAFDKAKAASKKKMLIHANFLQIPTVDWDSGNELSEKAIRAEYRKYALKNPADFLKSYGDEKLEIKYNINKAWESGLINNKTNPNKAAWKTGREICSISGLKSQDAITTALFEFSQGENGEEFLLQLKALNE